MNNETDVFTRQSGTFFKKNHRQFQWQTVLKKKLDIQQLTSGPITNDDSDNSKTVSNFDSIDDEVFSEFPVSINDAIWAAYSKNENIQKNLNALNTNQRILNFIIIKNKVN